MIKLVNSLKAWGTSEFATILKQEIKNIETKLLPLQEGLSQTSYVSDVGISVLILNDTETESSIIAKTGIFYEGIIAGSCCSDDPTPVSGQTEYCELQFNISKLTAETTVSLLED